ncbi:hypothetical protein FSP39_009954 [Pinctada imbricata]|uniref:B box-type domain-containing protein n=1 Tax=Pinctada imbricata TaxID=66713 RepID=A0AA88YMT2_PINIB|nr:hypothetical protein FSP39_009954 [Pinctada imbricata]
MASASVSEWLCEPCKENGEDIKARTQCNECHELLCEPCSNHHLRSKISKHHHLTELVQFIQKSTSTNDPSTSKPTSTSVNEDELASDFLETVTLTEDTVLYHGAQVAVESTSVTSKQEKRTISKQDDPRRLKATKCLEFSVKRPEDKKKVYVTGVLGVSDNVVVVDYDNNMLKLFDYNGTYISSTELKHYTWGITYVRDSMFATCGGGNTVYLLAICTQGIFRRRRSVVREDVSYHVDHWADGIHYNGTYYCILHRWDNAITILDRQGRQVREIITKEACGKKFTFGWDIHMDSDTNNIYVPCHYEDGVLCMTIDGKALWFTPLSRVWGITQNQGTLCVVNILQRCLHLMTKDGENVRKLQCEEDLGGKPNYVCYGQDGRLYVSYDTRDAKYGMISVYSVT